MNKKWTTKKLISWRHRRSHPWLGSHSLITLFISNIHLNISSREKYYLSFILILDHFYSWLGGYLM